MMFLWAICLSPLSSYVSSLASGIGQGPSLTPRTPGGVPFGAYDIVQNFNVPLQVQPQVFMALCLISWVQILIYNQCALSAPVSSSPVLSMCERTKPRARRSTDSTSRVIVSSKWPVWKGVVTGLAVATVFAGVEAALIVTIKVRLCSDPEL